MQAKSLFVPDHMFEQYYHDSQKISEQSLINITLSNGNYRIKDTLKFTKVKVFIIVGSKELKIMIKSANKLHTTIVNSQLYVASGMRHGEISMVHYQKYLSLIKEFFAK